jgi:hypothetical protein
MFGFVSALLAGHASLQKQCACLDHPCRTFSQSAVEPRNIATIPAEEAPMSNSLQRLGVRQVRLVSLEHDACIAAPLVFGLK